MASRACRSSHRWTGCGLPRHFLTTMVSLWWTHGEAVGAGAVGPMMLGGTSVSGFAIGAAMLIPTFGVGVGSTVVWLTAVAGITVPHGGG